MSFPAVLAGVRVVEQGTFITGPCCGMMLADLGADVIKVESPDGDPYRAYQGGQYSPHFQAYNRNKRSVCLDLKQAEDRVLFDKLIREADVYVQNFRPGTAERLGAGPERLQSLNPRLVYCSISGFGSSGPYVDRPSYDSVAQALSGFLSVVVDPERPRFLGPALADAITGIYAAYGVLGALFERSRTQRGRVVEVSMLEAMAHFAVEPFAAYFALGTVPKSSDRPRLAQAHILRTSDGGLIAIHLSSLEKFWTGLLAALEAPELGADPRFATRLLRIEHYEALGAELDTRFSVRPTEHWIGRLAAHDVPFAPINSVDAAVKDPQARHLGLTVPIEAPQTAGHAIRPAVQFDGQRAASVRAAPLLGEQTVPVRQAVSGSHGWPAA
jgi:crotonobetainyl-CoA:carnitine CoA-transferase CaiB-like acyl-CoA transferase